jgi:hypothetical protein
MAAQVAFSRFRSIMPAPTEALLTEPTKGRYELSRAFAAEDPDEDHGMMLALDAVDRVGDATHDSLHEQRSSVRGQGSRMLP